MTVEAPVGIEVFDRVLCGVDDSPDALEAARQASRLRSAETRRLSRSVPMDTAARSASRSAPSRRRCFTKRPVLYCLRGGRAAPFPASILVGVDGSEQSLAAARVAQSVAERFGSELTIAVATGGKLVDLEPVWELTPYFVRDPGRPVETLVGLAATFDLLVVGSRGLHGVAALGSVSERVATERHVRCSSFANLLHRSEEVHHADSE